MAHMGAPLCVIQVLPSLAWKFASALKLNQIVLRPHLVLTSTAGQDVASLPAGRAGLPHAVMFPRGLPSVEVCAAHLPGLEAVAAAGGGARRPRANTPVERAGLRGAVLQGAGPTNQETR